jgi:hypothetical protein
MNFSDFPDEQHKLLPAFLWSTLDKAASQKRQTSEVTIRMGHQLMPPYTGFPKFVRGFNELPTEANQRWAREFKGLAVLQHEWLATIACWFYLRGLTYKEPQEQLNFVESTIRRLADSLVAARDLAHMTHEVFRAPDTTSLIVQLGYSVVNVSNQHTLIISSTPIRP